MSDWESYEIAWADGKAAAEVKRDLRQRAVEMFGEQIAYAELLNEGAITLPLHAAKVLHACAKAGARKGQGRGNAMTIRRRAVEMFGQQIANEGEITLRLQDARVILACAKDGALKGQGRSPPRKSQRDELSHRAMAVFIRDRKDELFAEAKKQGKSVSAESAQNQAIKEVRAALLDRYKRINLNSTTLKLVQSKEIKRLTQKEIKRLWEKMIKRRAHRLTQSEN